MTPVNQIEQEFEELRKRSHEAFQVLDQFTQLHSQLEQLTQTQQELDQYLQQVQTLLQASPIANQSLELETQVDHRFTQFHSELLELRQNFEATTYDLQRQLRQDRIQIKHLEQCQQDPDSSQDGRKLAWLEDSLQDLSSLIYADRSALQHLDRRVNQAKRTIDLLSLLGPLSLIIMTVVLLIVR